MFSSAYTGVLYSCRCALAGTDIVLGDLRLLENTQETETYEILNVFNL